MFHQKFGQNLWFTAGCFLLGRQGGAPGITCAAAPTHGGAVGGVRPFVDEGGVASSPSFALVS